MDRETRIHGTLENKKPAEISGLFVGGDGSYLSFTSL